MKILFLGASPKDRARVRVDEEVREIMARLARDGVEFVYEPAARAADLSAHLLRHAPDVVHISGHGEALNSGAAGLLFEDADGLARPVDPGALARLFGALGGVRCAVLNACSSVAHARALTAHVDCVVGVTTSLADETAVRFGSRFYAALAARKSVRVAYNVACADLEIDGVPGADTLKLLTRDGVDAGAVFPGARAAFDASLGETSGETSARVPRRRVGAIGIFAALVCAAVGVGLWQRLAQSAGSAQVIDPRAGSSIEPDASARSKPPAVSRGPASRGPSSRGVDARARTARGAGRDASLVVDAPASEPDEPERDRASSSERRRPAAGRVKPIAPPDAAPRTWRVERIERVHRATMVTLAGPRVAAGTILVRTRSSGGRDVRCRVTDARGAIRCQVIRAGLGAAPIEFSHDDAFVVDPRGIAPEPE